ncbi:hypothetical protein DWW01_23155, partial [Escherichia coli]
VYLFLRKFSLQDSRGGSKWHANNVLLKNVNHLPRLHFLFEENVDVDITEISAHQDKLLP